MNTIGLLLDIGNIIFTITSLPQVYSSFKHRNKLKGLNPLTYLGYIIATLVFLVVMAWTEAWISFMCGCFNIFTFSWNIIWIIKQKPQPL